MKTKLLVIFVIVFSFFALFAQEEPDQDVVTQEDSDIEIPDSDSNSEISNQDNKGQMIGGDPVMSWEDGGQDFFVMFNSNIDNKIKLFSDKDDNPQGDACVESSSFNLDGFHIPSDAIIEKAYLIWMGAVDPAKLNEPTDNKVHLAFKQAADSNVEYELDVEAPEAKKLDAAPSFDFEGIRYSDTVTLDCSETEQGHDVENFQIGYFTYRVDVTNFFDEISKINKAAEHEEGNGEYYGTYTFSGLDCTEHDAYRCKTTMVSGWSLFFIYRSKNIRPKKIYLYNGLSHVYGEVSTAKVSGFELPQYPTVRLTTMIAEGDPGLFIPALPTESLSLRGQDASSQYNISNECNPVSTTHTEVFNSVSSIVNWDPEAEEGNKIKCVSGPKDEGVNYGIDVDTFLLNSEKEINLQEHLLKGNTEMEIKLSVNQDAIFTNFMVLSVDIKGSSFDIPDKEEKYSCSCPASNSSEKDYYCPYINTSREFYYLVRVQNWGEDSTGVVTIKDELDIQLDYVPGSTEMATKCNNEDNCTDWVTIPDKDGGVFPLSGSGYEISDSMSNCDSKTNTCKDRILVRYKVRPKKGIAKNYVFSNIAELKDAKSDDVPYKTNRSYPLKLKPTSCVPEAECKGATQEMCGGIRVDSNKECGDAGLPGCSNGYVCENFRCIDDPTKMCSDAVVTLELGKNTPQSSNAIIIPKDNKGEPLVVGQFTLQASNCEEGKVFNFNDLRVHFDTYQDPNFEFSNYELIYDADGNGFYDEAVDTIVSDSSVTTENKDYIYFSLKSNAKKYDGKILSYFLVRTKVNYASDEIKTGTKFKFHIQSEAVKVSSNGTSVNPTNEIEFAEFNIEPTGDYFIATTGEKDPAVPSIAEMNKYLPIMQIRTKSIGKENTIKQFSVKVPSGSFVKFGDKHGIKSVSLWIDTNNDGDGDIKVAEKTSFESNEAQNIVFKETDFQQPLVYGADEEKYLVLKVQFNMAESSTVMQGKVQIPRGGIKLKENAEIYELPLNSKTYIYDCKEGDVGCQKAESSSGCAVLEVESNNTNLIVVVAVLSAVAMLGFALLRKKLF